MVQRLKVLEQLLRVMPIFLDDARCKRQEAREEEQEQGLITMLATQKEIIVCFIDFLSS